MNMQERLKELIMELDPEIRAIVAQVVSLERDNLAFRRPNIKNEIKDIIDKYAKQGVEGDEA